MARQTLNLGSGFITTGSDHTRIKYKAPNVGPINALLVADSSIDVNLYTISINIATSNYTNSGRISLNFGGLNTRADLSDAWENYSRAVTLEIQGGASITVGGPNHSSASRRDTNEPYQWRSPNKADVVAWAKQITSSSVILITLDDGVALDFEATLDGGLSGSINANLELSTPEPLKFEANLDGNISGSIDADLDLATLVLDRQTLNLGSGFTIVTTGLFASIEKFIAVGPINDALRPSSAAVVYTRLLRVYLQASAFRGNLQLDFGTSGQEDLSDAWEQSANAITLAIQGGASVVLAGPNHSSVVTNDVTDPYLWKPSNNAALIAWASQVTNSSVILLTLDSRTLSLKFTANLDGNILGSINADLELSALEPLRFEANLDGSLSGSIDSDLGLITPEPLRFTANLDGDLSGSIDASLDLGGVPEPLSFVANLDGNLAGSINPDLELLSSAPLKGTASLDGSLLGSINANLDLATLVLNRQVLNLGSGFTIQDNRIDKTVNVGPVNSKFVDGGSDNLLVTSISIYNSRTSSLSGLIFLNFGSGGLSDAWENYSQAIKLEIQGGASVIVAGPNHSSSQFGDDAGPYVWIPSNRRAVGAWVNKVTNSSVILLTIADGSVSELLEPLEFEASLDGNLSGSINADLEILAALKFLANLDGDLAGSIDSDLYLGALPEQLDFTADLDGSLSGSINASLELITPEPLKFLANLDGSILGSINSDLELQSPESLKFLASLDGNLAGSLNPDLELSTLEPLKFLASLDGNLSGSINPDLDITLLLSRQKLNLGSGFTLDPSGSFASIFKDVVVGPVNSGLVDDRSADIYTASIRVYLPASARIYRGSIDLNFSVVRADLTDTWEASVRAVKLEIRGGASVVAAGPNHSSSSFKDTSEPYTWTPSNYDDVAAWAAKVTRSSVIILTLDDGTEPLPLEFRTNLDGNLSGSINANLDIVLPVRFTANLDGSLSGSINASLELKDSIRFVANLDGSLSGSIDADLELTVPLKFITNLAGELEGTLDTYLVISGGYEITIFVRLQYESTSVILDAGAYKPTVNLRYENASTVLSI